jgi:predicted HTH transcriptional regulator
MAREKRNFPLTYSDENVHRILNSLHLISDDGRVTNAALLLFAKDPQKWFVSSTVKCVQFYGTKMQKPLASQQIYGGSVFEVVDQAVSFVMSHIDARVGERTASAQVDVAYELPVQAVTETIVNAVVHRDYLSTGSVQVMLFKDRLEVWNPGRLPKGMTVEKLNGEHASLPVNPLLANPVYLAGYIEQVGTGTNDVIDRCVELGLRKPEFRQDEDFMVTLWRKDGSGTAQSDPESLPNSKESARSWQGVGKELGVDYRVLESIGDFCQEARSLSEIAEHLGLGDRYKMKKKYIDPILGKYIEMTIPEAPNSKLQQYILTDAGRNLM